MARKRKIPVRKHHGIRDPIKQKEKLERSLKNIINNPPTQEDQKPSNKFSRFQQLINDTKTGKKFKRQMAGCEDKPKNKANKNATPTKTSKAIKQFAGEDDEDYLRRVNRITRESLKEAQYEAKYGVKVVRDPKTGSITMEKKPKNEIDELIKQKAREKQAAKGKKKKQKTEPKRIDPKLAKQLIKQAIKEGDEEHKKEKEKELQEYKQDIIQFGEIVHAPPTISTLPRRAEKSETVPRPGKKSNLLLKSLLTETTSTDTKVANTKTANLKNNESITKIQLKGKRKDLPAATRSMLETERNKMVEIYRKYKKNKEKPKLKYYLKNCFNF